jgi:hypothetical protein
MPVRFVYKFIKFIVKNIIINIKSVEKKDKINQVISMKFLIFLAIIICVSCIPEFPDQGNFNE